MGDHMEEDNKQEVTAEVVLESRPVYDGFSPDYLRIYYGTSSWLRLELVFRKLDAGVVSGISFSSFDVVLSC